MKKNLLSATLFLTLVITSSNWAKKKEAEVDPEAVRALNAEISKLKKENKKLDKNIAHVDSMIAVETSRTAKLHQNYEKEVERKKKEIQDLKTSLLDLDSKFNSEKSTQAAYRNKMDELKSREVSGKKLLLKIALELEERIQNSLPWDFEKRLERIRVLKRDIQNENASIDESYTRLKSIYEDEIKLGDEITLQDKPITRKGGGVINAKVLKIGNQWMVYSDEEEKRFGVMSRVFKNDSVVYQWKEDLSFEEREAVRAALDIKSGKKPPGLVTLPLSLAIEQDQKGGL